MDNPMLSPQSQSSTVDAAISVFRPVLFPQAYSWFVALAAIDFLFTMVILQDPNGRELNVLADWVIQHSGVYGTAAYKFGLVLLVVLICEIVGRRRLRTGQVLARSAAIVTAFPVLVGAFHITNSLLHGSIDPT
jgi:hypothetical protein